MKEVFDDVRKTAKYLKKNKYAKTSKLILSVGTRISEMNSQENRITFGQEIAPLFDTFKEEFAQNCQIGQDYRRRCFADVAKIVLTAWGTDKQEELLTETKDFMERMQQVKRDMSTTKDLMMKLYAKTARSEQEGLLMFRLFCDEYNQAMEGVFNHLAQVLCVFIEILTEQSPDYKEIKKENLWRIRDGLKQIFGLSPVFLENLSEKKHIRNAIAHSQARFFPKENKVRFFTLDERDKAKILYDKTMTLEGFFLIYLELVDAIDSFYYAIEFAKIMTLLAFVYAQKTEH